MQKTRDWTIIAGGGVFRGAFGMGFFEALEVAGVQERFAEIHGYSVGSHNANCFINRRMFAGKNVYLQDITTGQAVNRGKIPSMLWTLFANLFRAKKNQKPFPTIMDVDFLIDKEIQYVPVSGATKTGIRLFMYFFDLKTESMVMVQTDNKGTDIYEYLRASAAFVPFYPHPVEIDDKHLVDPYTGSNVLNKKWQEIILNNPDKKYLILRNEPKGGWLAVARSAIISGLLFSIYQRKNIIGRKIRASLDDRKYWGIIEKIDNVVVVKPSMTISPLSDKQEEIDNLYNEGYKAGEDFVKNYL